MNIIDKLTLRHLRLNRGRTAITILGIALSVAMICCVAGFTLSLRDLGLREIKEKKGDWHVAYVDVSQETAAKIANEDIFSTYFTKDGDTEGLTNIYLRLEHPRRDVMAVAGGVAEKYGVERWGGNTELLALEGVIPYDNVMVTFISIAAIAILIIVAGSIIVIANAFYISASERVRQFGLLKSAGATSAQLRHSILFEAFLLAVIAIPIGILLGFLIQAVVLQLTNSLLAEVFALNNSSSAFRVLFNPAIIYISIAIAILTVLISAWLPARRAAKTSPIDAIRQTKDIQIRPKRLKTSRLTSLLFGFEGILAAKSLKRSRGKYRATVISLTVSIVLFVSMSSFVWVLNKGVEIEYGGYDFDVLLYTKGGLATVDEVEEILISLPDAQVGTTRRTMLETIVPTGFVTENAPESMTKENGFGLLLYPLPDAEFAKILPAAQESVSGILVNTVKFTSEGKRLVLAPYNCDIGIELPLLDEGTGEKLSGSGSVTIGAVVGEIPASMPAALFDGSLINVFIPESAYRTLFSANKEYLQAHTETMFTVTAADPDAFCAAAEEALAPYLVNEGDSWMINNISQITRLNRNITLIVMMFGYGFIAMLSLIAITSVVSTISTGMALRKQEFAMLYSVGMTSGAMNKMLKLESLLYGTKSLVIGLPIGVALSYMLYKAMTNTIEFAYQLPWSAMLISSAAVMLLTFSTMLYSKGKLNKISIVEAIRNETA